MSTELDRAVRAVVRECMGVSPGEEVLVVCNPATEEIGALMRIEAQGEGASATLAVIVGARIARGRAAGAGRGGDGGGRRRAGADGPVDLPHRGRARASEAGVRIAQPAGVTEDMLARLMSADMAELRRRGWALAGFLNGGGGGADHLPPRQRPAARARGPASRSSMPANSATAAPSATCPAARPSSRRSRARRRARSSSTARSPASAWSTTPVALTVSDGHLTDADRPRGRRR